MVAHLQWRQAGTQGPHGLYQDAWSAGQGGTQHRPPTFLSVLNRLLVRPCSCSPDASRWKRGSPSTACRASGGQRQALCTAPGQSAGAGPAEAGSRPARRLRPAATKTSFHPRPAQAAAAPPRPLPPLSPLMPTWRMAAWQRSSASCPAALSWRSQVAVRAYDSGKSSCRGRPEATSGRARGNQ